MRRSSHLAFRQGFIDVIWFVASVRLAPACSGDDTRLSVQGPPSGSAGEDGDGPEAPDDGDPTLAPLEPALPTVIAERVSALLTVRCIECHSGGMAEGGLGDLPELTTLVSSGQIVPGAGASSPLLELLQSEHPAMSRQTRFTIGELALFSRFIDELATASAPPCEPLGFMTHDAQLAALLADASSLSADVLPYTRYLTLSYASNAGVCGAALDRERHALFALINGVSTAPEIHVPAAIGESALFYRIDLRDYAWNRAIDLEDDGVVDFDDAWLAITAAAGDHATAFDGPEADELERLTQSRVPHLPVNVFIAAAGGGYVYYALTGQAAALYTTELRLGIDWDAITEDGLDGDISRAGFLGGDRGRNELMAMRLRQGGVSALSYWLRADTGDQVRNESIFLDPLGIDYGKPQAIFHLPNGMQAFAAADGNLNRLNATPPSCQQCATPRGNVVAAGCNGCHDKGLLPLEDILRPYVEDNRIHYDRDSFDAVLQQYPTPAELDEILAGDNAIYLSALERAGVPLNIPDPVSAAYIDFERPLTLRRTAAELGVSPRDLESRLGEFEGSLQILAIPEGRIARADFTSSYRNALCALLASAQNHPEDCPPQP